LTRQPPRKQAAGHLPESGPANSPLAPRPVDHGDETIKETIETIVIAFILAFVFRAFVVEAFVIPTGSMAPTLLGEHVKIDCAMCGYPFAMDLRGPSMEVPLHKQNGRVGINLDQINHTNAPCPMCFFPNPLESGTLISAGDRILVHKYIYSVPGMNPRRWDVVVFKAPHNPMDNYIKRLVGLPNESIQIIDGNVYIAPYRPDELGVYRRDRSRWRIARKTDTAENPHAQTIQRTVWQPVYHSRHVPLDAIAPLEDQRRLRTSDQYTWQVPWRVERGQWEGLDAANPKRSYRFAGDGHGTIRFEFGPFLSRGAGLYPYNVRKEPWYSPYAPLDKQFPRLEDLRIAADFTPESDGLAVQISTQARIQRAAGGPMERSTLAGRLDADGRVRLGRIDGASNAFVAFDTPAASVAPLAAEDTRNIELWYVDQELSIWVDGRKVQQKRFDADIDVVKAAPPLDGPPLVRIDVDGCPATLHHVQVDRDLYYTVPDGFDRTYDRRGGDDFGRGVSSKPVRGDSIDARGRPYDIYANQFFCLGDNSPESMDSRSWGRTDPWIRQSKFSNADADPLDAVPPVQDGVVPRRLMMGRAFFVYFPAMHGRTPTSKKFIPNFGDMRFIH